MKRAPDTVDLQILAALQGDARLTNKALADRIGLTAPPCLRRVQALKECGLIRGYHARLDAAKLGFGVSGFLFVGLSSQARDVAAAFERCMSKWPLVREAYALNGATDFLLHCVAHDAAELQDFVRQTLLHTPHVKSVRSAYVVGTIKALPGVPIQEKDIGVNASARDPTADAVENTKDEMR